MRLHGRAKYLGWTPAVSGGYRSARDCSLIYPALARALASQIDQTPNRRFLEIINVIVRESFGAKVYAEN